MYIISLTGDPSTASEKAKPGRAPFQSTSGAREIIRCKYEVARRPLQATANDEQKWEMTPYPLDRITGITRFYFSD